MGNDIFPINHSRMFKLSRQQQEKLLDQTKKATKNSRLEITPDLRVTVGLHRFETLHSSGIETVSCTVSYPDCKRDEDIPMAWFRILDHLRSWTNPLSFTKLLNAMNANNDFKRISRGKLITILKEMKKRNLIRKAGQDWTDKRRNAGIVEE